jgi:L-2-hydroxycarboxylate dehydrogenase (NAD+)
MPDDYLVLPAAGLRAFAARCFHAVGMTEEHAETAGRLLVRTELRGVETHGVLWIPKYCRAIREGRINARPSVQVVEDRGGLLHIDGDSGLGHVVSYKAMGLAMVRARTQGACFVAVRNSRHNGAASLYALQAAEAGLIGLSLTGGGVRVAPAGGREAMLGTNPIAFAAPAREEPPFVLDMATSVVAGAKVQVHAMKGLPVPEGWALDPEGAPTTDPHLADKGPLLPLGGTFEMGAHKGFGLGLMVETLCNVLTGMMSGPERAGAAREGGGVTSDRGRGMGHFFAALAPDSGFREALDRNIRLLRESRPAVGVERVTIPGEPEWRRETEREERGIPVYAATVTELRALGEELDVGSFE